MKTGHTITILEHDHRLLLERLVERHVGSQIGSGQFITGSRRG